MVLHRVAFLHHLAPLLLADLAFAFACANTAQAKTATPTGEAF
jgi:hypothetical protein